MSSSSESRGLAACVPPGFSPLVLAPAAKMSKYSDVSGIGPSYSRVSPGLFTGLLSHLPVTTASERDAASRRDRQRESLRLVAPQGVGFTAAPYCEHVSRRSLRCSLTFPVLPATTSFVSVFGTLTQSLSAVATRPGITASVGGFGRTAIVLAPGAAPLRLRRSEDGNATCVVIQSVSYVVSVDTTRASGYGIFSPFFIFSGAAGSDRTCALPRATTQNRMTRQHPRGAYASLPHAHCLTQGCALSRPSDWRELIMARMSAQ